MSLFRMLPGNRSAELLVYDNIGDNFFGSGLTARAVMTELRELDVDEINVRINSPGGNVSDGVTIYNALVRHPARVIVDVDGFAISAASLIAMCGDEIHIAQNGMMMVHEAQGFTQGDAAQHERMAATLRKMSESAAAVYASRASKDVKQVLKWMAATTWFTADDAVDEGLATHVTPAKAPPENCWDPRSLQMVANAPTHIQPLLERMVRPSEPRLQAPEPRPVRGRVAPEPPPSAPPPPPRPIGIGRLAHERHRRLGDV